jgi:hypothetical protein
MAWHLEYQGKSKDWVSSDANNHLMKFEPEVRWGALLDFLGSYRNPAVLYRLVYGPLGNQLVVWKLEPDWDREVRDIGGWVRTWQEWGLVGFR